MLYPNNSIVNIEDIGVGVNALHCITERIECCNGSDGGGSGEWYQLGQAVPIEGSEASSTANFSRTRGPSAVLLNRRNNATSPTGLYHCDVPDSGDVTRSLYIGVYGASGGEL